MGDVVLDGNDRWRFLQPERGGEAIAQARDLSQVADAPERAGQAPRTIRALLRRP